MAVWYLEGVRERKHVGSPILSLKQLTHSAKGEECRCTWQKVNVIFSPPLIFFLLNKSSSTKRLKLLFEISGQSINTLCSNLSPSHFLHLSHHKHPPEFWKKQLVFFHPAGTTTTKKRKEQNWHNCTFVIN